MLSHAEIFAVVVFVVVDGMMIWDFSRRVLSTLDLSRLPPVKTVPTPINDLA